MNKIKWIVCILSIALVLAGCTSEKGSEKEVSQLFTERSVLAERAENLTDVSDLIIVFIPEKQENVMLYGNDGVAAFGYTETTGTVKQVFKGTISNDEELRITEECFTVDSVLWTQGGYLPMQQGKQYLLFLKAYEEDSPAYSGMYYPVDLEYGKYLLDTPSGISAWSMRKTERFEVGNITDIDKYSEWRDYVYKIYPEAFS